MKMWPEVSKHFRAVTGGTECTMWTKYGRVKLSVSELGENNKQAEEAARNALSEKVKQRRSF